ncbi:MAG: hypothetical protein LBU32_16900 [Clostridiales bacterium]|nr:hypothetical protein [Clostridiales bacterium]
MPLDHLIIFVLQLLLSSLELLKTYALYIISIKLRFICCMARFKEIREGKAASQMLVGMGMSEYKNRKICQLSLA